ncbi:MAG: L-fucose:H+ symporter permease [Bacteroidia bacterium]
MKTLNTRIALIAVLSLFFLWALAHNLNPILIPHLKSACRLNDLQSALVDSAFYIAYFLMAIPAAYLIRYWGYRNTIVSGLVLFATGAFLFYPASIHLSYSFFLLALFIVASGLTFLETAANPYVTILGEKETATRRLNFAQSFNGLGASLAAFFGGKIILSEPTHQMLPSNEMSESEIRQVLLQEASTVQMPYIIIGSIVLIVAIVFLLIPLPEIKSKQSYSGSYYSLFRDSSALRLAMFSQFVYVGAQVGIGSFFIRLSVFQTGITNKDAAVYLSFALLLFMIGRFIGTFLMSYIHPNRLMLAYASINVILMAMVITLQGTISVYALVASFFFMSIMFPSIFSDGVKGLGDRAGMASSFIIMTIVGGAIFPLLMGYISDKSNIPYAFVVPLLSFTWIAYHSYKMKTK